MGGVKLILEWWIDFSLAKLQSSTGGRYVIVAGKDDEELF